MEILIWVLNVFGILQIIHAVVGALAVIWLFKRIFRD